MLILSAPFLRSITANWYQSYTLFPMIMDSILLGVLLGYLVNETKLLVYFGKKYIYLIVVFFQSYLGSINIKLGVFNHTWMVLLLSIITFVKGDHLLSKFFKLKILIGKLSFSLYIYPQVFSGLIHYYMHNQKPQINNWSDFILTV